MNGLGKSGLGKQVLRGVILLSALGLSAAELWAQPAATIASGRADAKQPPMRTPQPVAVLDQPFGKRTIGTTSAGGTYRVLKRGGKGGLWCKIQLAEGPGWLLCSGETEPTERPPGGERRDTLHAAAATVAPSAPGVFDYYLLSLSWSPSFCAGRADSQVEQCGVGKHFGLVVHGLWPQSESGANPMSCAVPAPLPEALMQANLDIMPSHKLIQHEWDKHGTCSGLTAAEYFAKARTAYQNIKIPAVLRQPSAPIASSLPQIEAMFIAENPGLTPDMVAVKCARQVSEIRFCLDKSLRPRSCGRGVNDSCQGEVIFPPLR